MHVKCVHLGDCLCATLAGRRDREGGEFPRCGREKAVGSGTSRNGVGIRGAQTRKKFGSSINKLSIDLIL